MKNFVRSHENLLNYNEIKIVRVSYELSVVIVYRTRIDVLKLSSLLKRQINPLFMKHGQNSSELTS